ncbi:hypothetical protein CASFOL_035118 [Castilleja foliolosa]|uniref:Uncharacterized protein n=1 Tax=Castilleja foliolosa TaxID=1961234 RepID=A0ABD3BSY0_9LAMI
MTVLSSKKILQENNSTDPNSITSLSLTHRALSDVSCLSEFKNLEKLDLGFNNLTSLEGLKSCLNLKWLSVVQNKLQSLKGIEGLTNLTVLNAGKNKLKSMDEVKSLSSLRALILNDNEIRSVCKLDHMKELNTLVLSRNPISSLGDSLVKLKAITKLSLSNCQLQTVDSSLKSCVDLKELRLAHNEIMNVPSEFGHLMKLQNLDIGNNLLTNRSNLKVLSSLVNLRILNIQGNPIAEKDNILNKVKKLLPNLHTFNGRPIDKVAGKEIHDKVDDFSVEADTGSRKKRKEPADEKDFDISEEKMKKNSKVQLNENVNVNPEESKKPKHKKEKTDQLAKGSDDKRSRKKTKVDKVNTIDNSESPFMDLFLNSEPNMKIDNRTMQKDVDANSGLVTHTTKKKKRGRVVDPASLEFSEVDKIGLGGPSAWD